MKFHPFTVKVVDKESNKEIKDIQSFKKANEIISLFKFNCSFMDNEFTIGDLYYNEKDKNYFMFSLFKCEESGYNNGINGFGFYELSFINDYKDVFFYEHFYHKMKNDEFRNVLKNSLFKGNLFLIKEEDVLKENSLPFFNKNNYQEIVDVLISENFILNLGFNDDSFSIKEVKKKLPLGQVYLEKLLNGYFSIRLYEKSKNTITDEVATIISYTGNINRAKKQKLESYFDAVSLYDKYRAKIISFQNEKKIKIPFEEFVAAVNFYKETVTVLNEKGIEFINTNESNVIINDYLKSFINPVDVNAFDILEEDYNNKPYVNNLLRIIS